MTSRGALRRLATLERQAETELEATVNERLWVELADELGCTRAELENELAELTRECAASGVDLTHPDGITRYCAVSGLPLEPNDVLADTQRFGERRAAIRRDLLLSGPSHAIGVHP